MNRVQQEIGFRGKHGTPLTLFSHFPVPLGHDGTNWRLVDFLAKHVLGLDRGKSRVAAEIAITPTKTALRCGRADLSEVSR